MKKVLLSVASVATFLMANAQDAKYVIYDGTTTDILTGGPAYGFDGFDSPLGFVNSDSTHLLLEGNTVWYVEGTVASGETSYVGGTGNANFQAEPNDPTLFGINLTNINGARFSFNYLTDAAGTIDVDFESQVSGTTTLVGTANFSIIPVLGLSTVDTTLAAFKSSTGGALSAADWATVNKITLKYSLATPQGTIRAAVDNITITDGTPVNVSDEIVSNFKNEEVRVYNMTGSLITTGMVEDLNLESGFYILKSASKTEKVIIK